MNANDTRPLTERVLPFGLDESAREPAPPLTAIEAGTVYRFLTTPDALAGESDG